MIHIRGLRKAFGARAVLGSRNGGVDAQVPAGAVVALVGASGSGKSTLLRCLSGLEAFDAGSIEVAGHRLEAGTSAARGARLRGDVGIVFQDYQLFPHLSVLENVTLAPRVVQRLSAAEAERSGRGWLERMGLLDRVSSRPSELSGGQRQRVALARALAQGAKVLLLDEPTSALDPELRSGIRNTLAELFRERSASNPLTVLLATHDISFATELANETWVLDAGNLTSSASHAATLPQPESRYGRSVAEVGTVNSAEPGELC
jgi:ABC-type polar amino acid transport system ATPase subunit